jgi:hypothetical protein
VMVVRHFNAPPPRLSNLAERARTLGKPPVVPFIEAINAGQNALVAFMRGDAAALGPASEKLEKAPAPSPDAEALRDDLKALVARARDTEADKSLKPAARRERIKRLDDDFGAWQERFSQWIDREGEDFGIGIQKGEKKQDGDKK